MEFRHGARVRSEPPSWTLRSCAIRSVDGERTRVCTSVPVHTYEKGGVVVASPVHLYNENFHNWIGRASEDLKKQDGDCTKTVSTSGTGCSDLSLGLLEHSLRNKTTLNLASRRLGHDIGEEDLLIVRVCYTTLKT
jgi:hypothetical protein